jgi:hypothetical protein
MAVHRSVFFTNQEALAAKISVALNLVITAIDNAALVPAATLLVRGRTNKVHEKVQSLDIAAPKAAVSARKIGTTDWFVYYCDSNVVGTIELLMIGKFSGAGNVVDYFDWTPTNNQTIILSGQWNNPNAIDDTVDMASTAALINNHNNKHFGGEPAAAQYTIGNAQTRKAIVAGMELKAVQHGLKMHGETFFRFAVNVGTDGQYPQAATNCIRIDTPGIPTQHSHPIPENKSGTVSHDGKVKSAILHFTINRDLGQLVAIAKYLTIIGCNQHKYKNLKNDATQYGDYRPPDCHFWKWGA